MPADVSQLPVWVQLKNAKSGVFDRMQQDIRSVTGDAKRQFDNAFKEIDQTISRALSQPRSLTGGLDLGVNELRQAAAAQSERARAAEEVARATRATAAAEGDYSARARATVAAAEALAIEERQSVAAARDRVFAIGQVQRQLDLQARATDVATAATSRNAVALRAANDASRASRFGMIQLGQQLQDSVIQLQTGTSALTVFTQQGSQAVFALANMGGPRRPRRQRARRSMGRGAVRWNRPACAVHRPPLRQRERAGRREIHQRRDEQRARHPRQRASQKDVGDLAISQTFPIWRARSR